MNKRLIAMLLAVVMLLVMTACKKNADEKDVTDTSAATEESIPGVINLPENIEVDWDTVSNEKESEKETAASNETSASGEEAGKDSTQATTAPTTAPEEGTTEPTNPAAQMTEYEWYNSLSGAEQRAFMESFDSIEAFFEWYNNAKAEYEALKKTEISDGVIDLGELAEGNG